MKRLPDPNEFDEYDLRFLVVGQDFDVPDRLGTLLVLMDYADFPPELRAEAADRTRGRRK